MSEEATSDQATCNMGDSPHPVSIVKDYLTAVLALATALFGFLQAYSDKLTGMNSELISVASVLLVFCVISCFVTFGRIDGNLRGKRSANAVRAWANISYMLLVLSMVFILIGTCQHKSEEKADEMARFIAGSRQLILSSGIDPKTNLVLKFAAYVPSDGSYSIVWIDSSTQDEWNVLMSKNGNGTKIDYIRPEVQKLPSVSDPKSRANGSVSGQQICVPEKGPELISQRGSG